ncbi:MAG: hypothetical protein K1X83_10945 [Oligoflexia bacterium]|nr:hypothetical protein [Oligoflexia bacterium]
MDLPSQMRALLIWSLIAAACVPGRLSAQAPDPRSAHFEGLAAADPIELVDAIRGASRYQPTAASKPDVPQSTLDLWRGYEPDWRAEIEEVSFTLHLSPTKTSTLPMGSSTPAVPPDSISHVKVIFQDEKIVVRSDSPRYRQYVGGLRFSPSLAKDWRQLLPGQGLSSLAVLLPRQSAEHPGAVLICPVGAAEPAPGQVQPEGVQFEISEIKFGVGAHVRGSVQSGVGVGSALAVVQTTENILPSLSFLDEAVSHDPSVSVEYTPDKKLQAGAQPVERGGVRTRLELQNAAGYQRISELTEVASVKQVAYPEVIAVRTARGESSFPAGSCIAVQKSRVETHQYSRGAPPILPTAESSGR